MVIGWLLSVYRWALDTDPDTHYCRPVNAVHTVRPWHTDGTVNDRVPQAHGSWAR